VGWFSHLSNLLNGRANMYAAALNDAAQHPALAALSAARSADHRSTLVRPRLAASPSARYTCPVMGARKTIIRLTLLLIAALPLAACQVVLPLILGRGGIAEAQIVSAVTDANGLARVESAAGMVDFQVTSGLSGERLEGVRVRVATFGGMRLLLAEDAGGDTHEHHLPVAAPLVGEATVRRLVMPPTSNAGYNITSAAGVLDVRALQLIDVLSEEQLRQRLEAGPDEAVLIYLYNPARPLALTGAPLEAYATPFENVTVLRAPAEPSDAALALVIVALRQEAYAGWSNRAVDRFLAARIGQPPDADLSGDLAFRWAYPVYDIYPADEIIEAGEAEQVTLTVGWRSENPDPPPPWSFFVSSSDERVTVEPESFSLGPDVPPVELTVHINREGLPLGQYTASLFIQPFSEAFGLIEQRTERTIAYEVGVQLPTPTPAPSIEGLLLDPPQPRAGERLTITALGFAPNETVFFELIGAERSIRDSLPKADAAGVFTYEVDLSTVPAGDYTLRLTGAESGTVGEATLTIAARVPDAVVASDELNLRAGPGYEYPVLEVLVRGDALEAITTNWNNEWMEVEAPSGRRGWVLVNLLTLNVDLADVPFHPQYGRAPTPGP